MDPYERFRHIRGIVLDIDGVCTDNLILVTDHGEFLRQMNVRDGFAIKMAVRRGLQLGIISGGRSEGTLQRFQLLGVREIHLGVDDKLPVFQGMMAGWGLPPEEIAYMGDDIPDLVVLQAAGLSCCPSDAAPEILRMCQYISPFSGGRGCVRDLIEKILRARDQWF